MLKNNFLAGILNSYSQVFFSRHKLFAIIIMFVSFFDLFAGLSGLLAVIATNSFALVAGFNRDNIIKGYYGFNSLLVGMGIGILYQPGLEFFVVLLFASVLTVLFTIMLEGVIGKYGLPYLSIPFLLGLWMVMLASRQYTSLNISERGVYALNEMYALGGLYMVRVYEWFYTLNLHESVVIYFRSIGAIFFQYHLLPGLLVAIGLLIYSRIAFTLSILGFFSAYLFYRMIGADINELSYTYIGFNYILTAIAVGGFFVVPSKYSYLWAVLLTPLISIVLTASSSVFALFQLPVYSLPFNLVVLLFIYTLKFREKNITKPELITYQKFSPEQNLYYHNNLRARFGDSHRIPLSLPFWGEWDVTQGHNGEITHKNRWKHAWDFEIFDDQDKSYKNSGDVAEDYFCFNKPVLAPADGWIEKVQDGIEDNIIGQVNLKQNWGNTVVIRHGDKFFTALSHLKNKSIQVAYGDYVKKGDIIGHCGNSGRSPYPHLHFQVQASPHIGSATIDIPFWHYLMNTDGGTVLKSVAKPEKKQQVSNITPDKSLTRAFSMVPGQKIYCSPATQPGGEDRTEAKATWEVHTDFYNDTFIQCTGSQAKAYFKSDGGIFYFTAYEGSKHTLLYHFYRAAYKITLGCYKGLEVHDFFPQGLANNSLRQFMQDFAAPFHTFLKTRFTMNCDSSPATLDEPVFIINSSINEYSGNKLLNSISYQVHVENNSIEKFIINEKGEALEVICTSE